ncbi:MAG: hypothetical protein OXG85_16525 [Chloroflexi bacterium]|nr:hypothetical protein [Chloroflexota bacterium]
MYQGLRLFQSSQLDCYHYGIAYFPNANLGIGYAVNALMELYRKETADSVKNGLRYV